MKKPVVLTIMDGFGINPVNEGNAIFSAATPNLDRIMSENPATAIGASGMDVGLPDGQMGNSEVGHTNIGAGRVVYQELTRITKSIADGDFFENEALVGAIENCKKNGTALHLLGLLSDGGVHSHNKHLYGLLELAKKAGLPVDKLICASNENNVLTDFFKTGVYDKNRKFHLTDSPSMDILISSNLERLLFMLTDGNDVVVRNWMDRLKKTGKYDVGPNVLQKLKDEGFLGYFCNDDQTEITVHDTWFAQGYLCDTHTGVAVNAYEQYTKETGDETPCVVVSTASPFKFAPAILPAMDLDFQGTDFQMLEAMEIVSCMKIPAPLKSLKDKKPRFETVIDKDAMKQQVLNWLSE